MPGPPWKNRHKKAQKHKKFGGTFVLLVPLCGFETFEAKIPWSTILSDLDSLVPHLIGS